jgi:hypothetical protein
MLLRIGHRFEKQRMKATVKGRVDKMLRQQRRRLDRQWNKIKVGAVCTDFLERNSLFKPPHIIEYHLSKCLKIWCGFLTLAYLISIIGIRVMEISLQLAFSLVVI